MFCQQHLQQEEYGMQFMENLVEKAVKLPLEGQMYRTFVQSVLDVVSQKASADEEGDHNNFLRTRLLLTVL